MTASPTSRPSPAAALAPHAAAAPRQTTFRPDPNANDGRRLSIQFMPHSNTSLPTGSPKAGRVKRRISSPPPPPVFQPRVSFDTFDKPADFIEENSFTLVTKHKDYVYTKRSRTFLCGCDDNEYSEYALQWLIDELVDDGDEIVCLRVVDKDSSLAADPSVEKGRYRSEAEALMKQIQERNHENKAVNLILEFAMGKVNKVIDEMINLYEPAILVVGTRGRSLGGFQGLLPGSVSKYCLQHSPVPVIVVRPSYKRDKARSKRAQDPNRHGYKDILEKSGEKSGHILDYSSPNYISETGAQPLPEDDDAMAATGYRHASNASPLSQVATLATDVDSISGRSARSSDAADSSPHSTLKSPEVVMKSPELQGLDSPEESDSSSSEDEASDRRGVSAATRVQSGVSIAESSTAAGSEDARSSTDTSQPGLMK